MWEINKVDKKKIDILKKEFSKKLDKEIIFYQPKIKIEKYRKNKLENKVVNILGDYIFCYHKILEDQKIIDGLQYCIGVKYFLRGCKQFQKDIEKFINKFKSFENEEGYVSKSFFEINKNTYYRFSSGPFTQQVFKIIEIQKDKINILLGKVKTTINRKDFLLSPA
jgi:transcription antitermination factor NusG